MIKIYHTPKWVQKFYPEIIFSLPQAKNEIALTFDDGPDVRHTPAILKILDGFNIKATFFVSGSHVNKNYELVQDIDSSGHLIGNHFYSHSNMFWKSGKKSLQEVQKNENLIHNLTGKKPSLIRPPFGKIKRRTVRFLKSHGYRTILWDVMPYDFTNPGVDQIVKKVIKYVKRGSIITLHDGGGVREQTVKALPEIIDRLRDTYTWVTLGHF